VLSALQVGYLQTWLLYHNALSAGVAIEDVLKYARKTKERGGSAAGDTQEMVEQLRRQLTEQEKLLRSLVAGRGAGETGLPGYGAVSSSDPLAGIEMPARVGAKAMDSALSGAKMTATQPAVGPQVPPPSHPPLSTSSVGSKPKALSIPVAPASSSSSTSSYTTTTREPERSVSGEGAAAEKQRQDSVDSKKTRQSSNDNLGSLGSTGRLKSLDKQLSNASLASDSSFDASFNTDAKPAPKDFSFSQPSALPPRR
jgi:hypothetical protein